MDRKGIARFAGTSSGRAAGDGRVGALARGAVARVGGARLAVIALGRLFAHALRVTHPFGRSTHVVAHFACGGEGLGRVRARGGFVDARIDGAHVAVLTLVLAGRAHALLAQVAFGARVVVVARAVGVRVLAADNRIARVGCARVVVVAREQTARARSRSIAHVVLGAGVAVVATEARWLEHARTLGAAGVLRAGVVVVAGQLAWLARFLRAGVAKGA